VAGRTSRICFRSEPARADKSPSPFRKSALGRRETLCDPCHGQKGRGVVADRNSTNGTVSEHITTAQQSFLLTPEDADTFIRVLSRGLLVSHTLRKGPPAPAFARVRRAPTVSTRR